MKAPHVEPNPRRREPPPRAAGLPRRDFLHGAGAAAVVTGALGFPAIVRAAPRMRRVISLGIDGMDPALLTSLIEAGAMPNAARLVKQGGFRALGTSDPPQSPVAWSNFISGTNPGGHGIFDFIARDAATRVPYLSTSRLEDEAASLSLGKWSIPLGARDMVNLRRGPTFWKNLEEHGVPSTVLRMPANFPPTPSRARTLSGLGTPDIHGSYGIFSLFTSRPNERTRDVSGGHIEAVKVRRFRARCALRGPQNSFHADASSVTIPFTTYVDPDNEAVRIAIQEHTLVLKKGDWSRWIRVRFPMMGRLVNAPGVCRFYLMAVHPHLVLYVSPVNIDPSDPSLPISTPGGYSRRLAEEIGTYYTQGMPPDTSALSAGVLNDAQYREQAVYVLDEERRIFEHEFNRFREGYFFAYFCSLDLNSHVFWRTRDTDHPAYSDELARRHGDFLPWLYRKMDDVIGEALDALDDRTLLLVNSDHGFGSFRRQFNLNGWLMDHGYARPLDPHSRGRTSFFQNTDWPHTRAYGLGINSLYLNLRGREADGCVRPGPEQEGLLDELIARLKGVKDPKTGRPVIANVYRPTDVYTGPHTGDAPDLIVGYAPDCRASWDTILGGYAREHVLDNEDPWSGDHATYSSFMSGVLLSSRPIRTKRPRLLDMAPTILDAFGAPVPEEMTGEAVL